MSDRPADWPRRSKRTQLVGLTIERRPNAHGSNLVDQSQPTIMVSGRGIYEFMGRWSTLCGVPDGSGGTTTVNAIEASDEQIAYALLHDESIFD